MPLSRDEKRALLQAVPLFRGSSAEAIERMAGATSEFTFEADAPIVKQGQVGNGLYIIISGGVRVVAGSDQLARLGPGEFFGELSVIDQRPRTATAFADGETVCLALAAWDLMALLEQEPGLAMNMLRELAGRLRDADAQLRH
jgi:CRP-like cAMP-binding protein